MGIKLMALLHCKSDAEETLEQELKKLVESSVKEDGCLKYELYQYEGQRCHYMIMEDWQAEESLNKHKESPHYKNFMRIIPVLIEKPVELITLGRLV